MEQISENYEKKHPVGRPRVYPELVNPALRDVLIAFEREKLENNWGRMTQWRRLWHLFEESLGDLAPGIRTEADFNAATFLQQAEYIRLWSLSCNPEQQMDLFVFASVIPFFYRHLEDVLGRTVFAEGAAVTSFLLSSPMLSRFLRKGATFVVWDNYLQFNPGHDFYVLTVHGLDQLSSQMKPVDFVTLDLSSLEPQFRKVFFKYFISSPSRLVRLHNQPLVPIYKRMLDQYLQLKTEPGYTNPDIRVMTRQEMAYMRACISDGNKARSSANTMLRYFRDFVRWADASGYVKCDVPSLNRLRHFKQTDVGRRKGIEPKHLERMMARAKEWSGESLRNACCYVAMRILVTTKMRVSGLCALSLDCLRQTPDRGVWQVVAPSKTSRNGKEVFTITDADRRAIEAIIAVTAPVRPAAEAKGFGNRVFVYDGRSGIRPMDRSVFSQYLTALCDDLELPHYYPCHVRATRMTRAAKYAEEHGLSRHNTEMLTGHRRKDMTMNNYISVSAKDYYGAMYGVMLEDVQAGVHGGVVERLEDGSQPAAGDGARLGACVKEDLCTARTLLPCLTCSSFVTDVHHLSLFEQAIEDIDRRIEAATVPHDREDLINIKEIYVLYITKIKEVIWKSKTQ